MPHAISELAAFCVATDTVDDRVQQAALRTLLDTIGVAAIGSMTSGGRASFDAAPAVWGSGRSRVWFSGRQLTAPGAVFVNATYAASLDLDDGHRGAAGHPAAAIVPAVLALAGDRALPASRLLTAIALGYEVAVRVAASRDVNALRTTDSGLWCGYGTAAAAAWLLGCSAPIAAHAMAISGQTATGQYATGWTRLGHTVKEGIPWAAANGVQAAFLAAAGHTGPTDLLDEASVYDRTKLLDRSRSWAVEQAYFKRYSCCRWAHAAIDAALLLQEEHVLVGSEIDEILVETFERAITLPNQPAPTSNEAAQYSIPFCVAVALLHGKAALLPLEDRYLADPAVLALASRVTLKTSPRYAGAFPSTTPATLSIVSGGRRFALEVVRPKGEPTNPMSGEELAHKFEALTSRLPISKMKILSIAETIRCFGRESTTADLLNALCNPS
jgi:2-methylcitrate dehydratase PrpD